MKKWKSSVVIVAIALLAVVALVGSAAAQPDLAVTKNHPGYVFSNLTNVMTAYVENSGDTNAADFNVSIEITNTTGTLYAYKATGVSVDTGVKEEVSFGNWKPTKVENITINVTADCDGDVNEGANETDNSRIETRNSTGGCADSGYTNTMLEKECFGFRGQHPLIEAYTGGSDVIYTVGDYKYQNTTVNFEIGASGGDVNRIDGYVADIPAGATIEQATLYLYHAWRKGKTPKYPDWTMNFTNSTGTYTVAEAVNYTDCKGFGTSYMRERLYGTIVYDVTNYVTGNGTYTANVTGDIYPYESSTSYGYASGMALMVVYDDGSSKAYRIAHGYDRLSTYYQYSATSTSSYNVLPEDATTSATLTDANPSGDVTSAKLFTATVDGVDYSTGNPAGESLKCNDCAWNEGAWSNDGMGDFNYPIGFSRAEVTTCLSGAGTVETVYFQERDTSTNKNSYSVVFAMLAITKEETQAIFDTDFPAKPYPSIMGIHEGKIIPSCNINVSKLYTYPCTGTGGHTKSIELRENDYLIANGTWSGYIGDYHNITLQNVTGVPYVTLQKDHEYNYTIRTGSYPQIIHEESKDVTGGTITCTKFVDANGKEHNDWIPAIRLWG